MKEIKLKYGCNPNQQNAKIFMQDGEDIPLEILNGNIGYINLLDALNGWQLVKELKEATSLPAATSFKHLSPTSAAVYTPISEDFKKMYFVDDIQNIDTSHIAIAYAKARGTDRLCSFGDFIALSDICDDITAKIIEREVSDGIIAPGYTENALKILKNKRKGSYNIIKIDPDFIPKQIEQREVFGIVFAQDRNNAKIDENLLNNVVSKNTYLDKNAKIDLLTALVTLKYTQSNSVCYAYKGQAIGVGAGQQSRIHCTKLAGEKADKWHLRQHPKTLSLSFLPNISRPEKDNAIDTYISDYNNDILKDGIWQNLFYEKPKDFTKKEKEEYLTKITGVSLGSDAFFPFADNIDRAFKSGVSYIAAPRGSIRDNDIIKACDGYNMTLIFTDLRLFHH